MPHWLTALAEWAYANVLGNLVASAVTTTIAVVWHHNRMATLIRQLHRRVDHLHEKVDAQSVGGDPGDRSP